MNFSKLIAAVVVSTYLAVSTCLAVSTNYSFAEDLNSKSGSNNKSEKIVAKIKFQESSFDFGTVSEGTVVSHIFNFQNIGKANLLVQRVVSGCGCTTATSSSEAIAPGASGFIKVDFDSSGFAGTKTKFVHIYSNDFDDPEITLTLKGNIDNEVVIEPSRIMFDDVIKGAENVSQQFKIKIKAGSEKSLTSVSTYSKFLKIEPISTAKTQVQVKSFNEMSYRVTVDPNIPLGELRERILVNLSNKNQPSSITLPVLGKVSGTVLLEPAQISFGIVEGKAKLQRSIKLSNRGKTPIDIISVSSDSAAVVPSFKVIEPGKNYIIHVTLDSALVVSDLRALVEVKTSSVEEPSLYLSVFGVTPPKLDF